MKDIGPIHQYEYETSQEEPVAAAYAPGRLHFLGEHGEPRSGLFLSAAIDRYAAVAVNFRKDNSLRFYAADLGERKRTTIMNLKYKREDRWANFIKVAIFAFSEKGYPVRGFNFTLSGDIPMQVGLSSSSAIEAAAGVALRSLYKAKISDMELAEMLSNASGVFFGRRHSPVDYLAAFMSKKGHFIVLDERDMTFRLIKAPLEGYKILLMDSKVPRIDVEEEIKRRRQDIKRGLESLSGKKEGASFRDLAAEDVVESMGKLPEQIRRRCLHVVNELDRVREASEALSAQDYFSLLRTITHSHESLRDLYEVSCPELDWLVKRAQETEGVIAARMMGRGFGGCTYTIIAEKSTEEFAKRLEDYERIFGFHPVTHEIHLAGGVGLV
jgi:galactokinase